jgi:hypothetical protein
MAQFLANEGGRGRLVLVFAATAELATGLALLAAPSVVSELLLGKVLTGTALPVARVAGIALTGLALTCWPGPPWLGMLIYSVTIALYLAFLGFTGGASGALLWPAVILHLVLAVLLRPGARSATVIAR